MEKYRAEFNCRSTSSYGTSVFSMLRMPWKAVIASIAFWAAARWSFTILLKSAKSSFVLQMEAWIVADDGASTTERQERAMAAIIVQRDISVLELTSQHAHLQSPACLRPILVSFFLAVATWLIVLMMQK